MAQAFVRNWWTIPQSDESISGVEYLVIFSTFSSAHYLCVLTTCMLDPNCEWDYIYNLTMYTLTLSTLEDHSGAREAQL